MRLLLSMWAVIAAVLAFATPAPAQDAAASTRYVVRYDHWTDADEKAYSEFIAAIGDSQDVTFHSDCAELPYVLRTYFAWKRGLPFSYESAVEPRGATNDVRYTMDGNEVSARADVLTNS